MKRGTGFAIFTVLRCIDDAGHVTDTAGAIQVLDSDSFLRYTEKYRSILYSKIVPEQLFIYRS